MANRRLSVRLPRELHEKLEEVARHSRAKESEIVRDALEEFCSKWAARPTAYDLAQAAGLIGCTKGPHDLSTNPKHLEGFGRG